MQRVADYLMERLRADGVRHIFLVTGRGALFLTDAVARLQESVSGISCHHEQAAAFAAAAYAQHSGQLGVCLVSTGCAATNALTGTLSAWQDGLPCVFISGQNTLRETTRFTGKRIRTYGQQEADIVALAKPITKYAVMISDPLRIAYELDKALHLARSGRQGPVWIDVPLDVQSMRVEPEQLERYAPQEAANPIPSAVDVTAVADSIRMANRPVVLIGSGVRAAGAIESLTRFLGRCNLPVVYAASAVDTLDADNPLVIGSAGTMGSSRAGCFAVQNADLLLVLGHRLSSMTTGTEFQKFARAAKTIVVDIDPEEHSKDGVRIDHLIIADLGEFIPLLDGELGDIQRGAWLEKCQHWTQAFPACEPAHRTSGRVDLYLLACVLSQVLPPETSLITDSGFAEVILPTNVAFSKGRRSIHPVSQGAMGFALPAIVGAHFASGKPVVAVVGDGSVMMNLQELQTIRHHGIPAKILVIDNNVYAIIRRRQKDLFRTRTIGTDPSNGVSCPDFRKVAAAFDFTYVRIENANDLDHGLETVMATPGPVLCHISGREDQAYVETSIAKNSSGRLVRRPLEDQAPFLDRETFLAEMIIDPIDQ
jgi:acetolactate synthase-1/2/3 large subunit